MDKFILVIGILGSALLVIALVVLIYSIIKTVKRERKVTKFIYSLLTSIIMLAFASAFIYLALFLQTFSRYTHEEKIGWVHAAHANDSTRVTYYDKRENRMHFFTTAGDQWVIEGYFLRWGTVLRWPGAGAYYRVTRLSGRWEKEETKIVSIYRIHPEEHLWRFLLKHAEKIPGVDAAYGIAAFQYPSPNTFYLYINDTGFILRKH